MTILHHNFSKIRAKDQKLSRLVKERRELATKLQQLDGKIAKLKPTARKRKSISPRLRERLLDELANGVQGSKSLPEDFSRADIYDDHD